MAAVRDGLGRMRVAASTLIGRVKFVARWLAGGAAVAAIATASTAIAAAAVTAATASASGATAAGTGAIILKKPPGDERFDRFRFSYRKLEDASSGSGLVRVATLYSNGVASQRGPITPLRDVDSSYMSPVTFRACLRKDRDCA
ncbi:hypothetical protein HZH66_011831 [Vespula vulgaris]|uniref:Uncharacterized protein n=1 Tax=Vespula vulgaris TaxID=7454 RepID=A0A834JCR4_VESVU|nr:hypothetical protein HZH66_011831 [Vespula vulgaris]